LNYENRQSGSLGQFRADELRMLGIDDSAETADGAGAVSAALHSLRRRWLLVCLLGLPLALGGAYAAWELTETEYIARAVLRFNDKFNPMQGDRRGQAVSASGLDDRATQRQLITSPAILDLALQKDGIGQLGVFDGVLYRTDRTGWLEDRVDATFPGDSDLLYVTVRCNDKDDATKLTKAIVETYQEYAEGDETKSKANRTTELYSLVEDLEKKINDRRQELDRRGFGELLDQHQLTLEQKSLQSDYFAKNEELREVRRLIAMERAQRDQRDSRPGTAPEGGGADAADDSTGGMSADAASTVVDPSITVSDAELELAATQDSQIKRYELQIQNEQNGIENARRILAEPQLQKEIEYHESQIERWKERIEERKSEVRDFIVLQKKIAKYGSVSGGGQSLDQLQAREQSLQDEMRQIEGQIPGTGTVTLDALMVRDEIDDLRTNVREANEQIRELELGGDNDSDRITVISPGHITPGEAERRRMMKCGGIGVLSFLAWAGLVVGWDFRRQRVSTPLEVSKALQLRVLGVVPLLKHRKRRNIQQSERFAEAVDGVSAALLCGTTGEDHRILLISSAMAGEGKTTLAANLASSLANAGRKTLLVDFDLRRPMLHRVYDIEVDPGISEVLVGESSIEEAIHDLDDSNMKLLTAGRWRQRSLSHLTDQNVAQVFERLRTRFDFVVVDASPILPAVDTRIVARHVDGVVLSMLRDVSETPKVRAACEVLNSFNANILGAVMIGASADLYYGYPLSSTRKRA
jgi:polysaccharide biosynthesis transport protein